MSNSQKLMPRQGRYQDTAKEEQNGETDSYFSARRTWRLGFHLPSLNSSSVYKLYSRQASCFSSLGQQEVAVRCQERARAAAELLAGEERVKALSYLEEKSLEASQTGTMAGTVAEQDVTKIIISKYPL